MPIDASIYALQKPVQPAADPGEAMARAMQIQNAQQARQLNAERLKAEQLANAERERKQRSMGVVRDTFLNAGGDPTKHVQMAAQGGADPEEVQALQKHYTDQAKSAAEVDDKTLGVKIKRNEMLLPLHDQALQSAQKDPQAFAQAWPEIFKQAAAIDPETAKHFSPDQPPTVEQIIASKNLHLTQDYVLKQAAEKRAEEEAKRQATAATDTHNAAALKLAGEQKAQDAAMLAAAAEQGPQALATALSQLPDSRRTPFAGLTAQAKAADIRRLGMSNAQVVTADQARANAERQAIPNTEAELAQWATDPAKTPEQRAAANAALKRLDQSKLASRPVINNSIPGMQIGGGGLNQSTGEEFLKSIPPSIAAQVKAIAEGRAAIPGPSSRSQAAAQIRDAVFRYDPTFSEQRAQVRKAFTTGKEGQNLGALNTAIVHLGRLGDTAEALQNGSFTPGNELYNWARDKFGSEKVTNFGLLKDAVAGEMASALKGTATDIEIEKMGKSIRASNSPAQMRGVIQEGMGILHDKATTYDERYHREMPDDTGWSPILPRAKEQLQKHGISKSGGDKTSGGAIPQVGGTFNGGKVLRVTRIQ